MQPVNVKNHFSTKIIASLALVSQRTLLSKKEYYDIVAIFNQPEVYKMFTRSLKSKKF